MLFLFLGVIFLSYFCYKFFRRFILKLFEYHPTGEVKARKCFVSPAIVTSDGCGVLWSDEIQGYKFEIIHSSSTATNSSTNIHSEIVDLKDQIKNVSTSIVEESKKFQNRYQQIHIDEEADLKRKERLYISALNSGRSH